MKWRPPLRTSEILAYNYGAKIRAAGLDLALVLPLENLPPGRPLDLDELDALQRLGADAFERWSVRGWAETPPPGGLN